MVYKVIVMLVIVLGTSVLYGYITLPSFRRVDTSKGPRGSQAQAVAQVSENTDSRIGLAWLKLTQALEHRKVVDDLRVNSPASHEDFHDLANALGNELPAELKAIWSIFSGQPPESSVGLDWRFLHPDESARWAKEQLSRGSADSRLSWVDARTREKSWMAARFHSLCRIWNGSSWYLSGRFLEDGQVYFQSPSSRFHLEADCLESWLNNFSARIERDETKIDGFGNLVLRDETLKSPGTFLQPNTEKVSTLSKNRFTKFSFFSLLALNSLRWLELEGCPLEELQRLRAALPHTYVNPRSPLPKDN